MDSDSKKDHMRESVIGATTGQQVERYGRAASEFIKGYRGTFDEDGNLVKKGLKQVAEGKVNKGFKYQNLKQQAGFAAEVDYVNRTNADNIINRSNNRVARSNDVGRGNDQVYDVIVVDVKGNPVLNGQDPQWGAQMKFCGAYQTKEEIVKSSENTVNKLAGKKWDKYRGHDVLVPKEQYEYAKKYALEQAEILEKQALIEQQKGNIEKAKQLKEQAEKYKQISKDIKNSGISSREAMFLREHPKLATAKHVVETAHRSGMEEAKGAAIVSGAISVSQNVVCVMRGDKEITEALQDTAIDVAKGSALGYISGASDTAIRGFMAASKNKTIVAFSKTSLPGMVASVTLQVGKSLKSYLDGEIDCIELVEELGEKGTGMLASSVGAAIGTTVFPGIGTIIGGMLGYMVSSSIYTAAMQVLQDSRRARENYAAVSAIVDASIEAMKKQRMELEQALEIYFTSREIEFKKGFHEIEEAIRNHNLDLFTEGVNRIVIKLGRELQFRGFEEFDDFMNNDTTALVL